MMSNLIKDVCVSSSVTIRDAMRSIDRGAVGIVFLVDGEGRLEGAISDGDIRRALLSGLGLESPVGEVEHPETTFAKEGMSLKEISQLFSEPVRIVPVIDSDRRLVDIVMFDKRTRFPMAEPVIGEEELTNVTEAVLSGWVSSTGEFVNRFERDFGEYCEASHAVSACNGTAALHLALLALEVGPGDEVIVPTLTFIASANAVVHAGARPVFVDSEPETWNIDPSKIEEAITARTKAIMAVHLYGHPADMDPIIDVARRHGIAVIEDAAEAHGAKYKGKPVGGIGDVGVFSFFGNKVITTGEGGMLVTSSREIARKARIFRDHGMSTTRRYWHEVLGYNYRMTNLQAALGVAQLGKIDRILEAKARILDTYNQVLGDIPGLTIPPKTDWATPICWIYSFLFDPFDGHSKKELFFDRLESRGVDTRPLFIPAHAQPVYNSPESFPVAESLSRRGSSIPSFVGLSEREVRGIAEVVREELDSLLNL